MGEPIELVLWGLTRVDPRNHVLDGIPQAEGAILADCSAHLKVWESLLLCFKQWDGVSWRQGWCHIKFPHREKSAPCNNK